MEEAEARARRGSAEATGTLRIGLHPVFQFCLYSRMGEFLSAHPGINAELSHTNSPASLLEHGLDVVLRVGAVQDSSFVARKLGSIDLQVYASPAYLREHGRPRHPRDLVRYRAIIPGRLDEESFANWTFSNRKKREIIKVPVRLVLHEGVGLAVSAVGGVGIVRMYDLAARPFTNDGSLEPILQHWSSGRDPVFAVIPSRPNVPAKVRAFIDFARSLLASVNRPKLVLRGAARRHSFRSEISRACVRGATTYDPRPKPIPKPKSTSVCKGRRSWLRQYVFTKPVVPRC